MLPVSEAEFCMGVAMVNYHRKTTGMVIRSRLITAVTVGMAKVHAVLPQERGGMNSTHLAVVHYDTIDGLLIWHELKEVAQLSVEQ